MKKFLMISFFSLMFIHAFVANHSVLGQEKFPEKPVTLLIGFSPGGSGDAPLRYLSDVASKKLGQPIVVINREGGGGTVALGEVKNAKPDGYTICFLSTGGVISAHMRKLPYDPVKDLEPIIQHTASIYGIAVLADSPYKKLDDLIKFAKENPEKVTYSTAGAGTPQHMVMIQLGQAAGVKWVHVPMRGGVPAVTQLLGGHVTCTAQATEWKPYVDAGRLRLLCVFSEKRMEEYPDVPTLTDLGYNIVAPSLYSVVGPRGVPKNRVKILHDAFYEGMETPGYKEVLKKYHMPVVHRNPEELAKYIKELYESSGKIIEQIKRETK